MTTELVYKIALWYIPIYILLVAAISLYIFKKFFKPLTYYFFNKLDLEWKPQVDKPRIFFVGFGYFSIWMSYIFAKMTLSTYWICTPLAVAFSIVGILTLICCQTNSFDGKFINYVKVKFKLENTRAIIGLRTHHIELIFKELNEKHMITTIDTFNDLLLLNKIEECKKIEWNGSKVDLIRFLFVLFDIKSDPNKNINHNNILTIIEHYFMIQNKAIKLSSTSSEISNVKNELDTNKDIFCEYRNNFNKIIKEYTIL